MATDKDSRLELESQLEQMFNKNQLLDRIEAEFTNDDFPFAEYMGHHEIPAEFGMALIVQMALHKRTTLSTLVGILRVHFKNETNPSQAAADMLLKAAEADLVDWDPTTEQFITRFTISQETQAELDMFQYPLPMVIQPRELTHNRSTPYLMLKDGSVILRRNHHDDDVCLDHLNRVNKIRFSLDMDTARMIQNKWRNLDRPKPDETRQEYNKRVKAFDKYDQTARTIMEELVDVGNEFYLTHKYDKRGRIYCQGYHVNYAGNPWNKAVLELTDKELIA